jgi:protocatechuate 3,4-dioxygenase beta subunit
MTLETAPFRPIAPGSQPANDTPSYGSTHLRHPTRPALRIPQTVTETTGPRFTPAQFGPMPDLSVTNGKQAQGERIIVQHDAPLDPHFHGNGRVFSDADGWYQFTSIKPGAYPWRNHNNAWRPNHIHYSLFGNGFGQRVITQMYFPGDPLLALDPIYLSIPDQAARERLIAQFDLDITSPEWALGYRFDFVLRGRNATPTEQK